MARKTPKKKKNHLSNNKKQTTPNPNSWPNHPHHLISLIKRQYRWKNITTFGCVTKSWISPSRQCTKNSQLPQLNWPQLVEIREKQRDSNQANAHPHILPTSIFNHWCLSYYYWRISFEEWCPGLYFKGRFRGRIVVMADNLSDLCLWEPARHSMRYLPPWDPNLDFKIAILTPSAEDPDNYNVMVLTGTNSPAFAFYRPGESVDRGWTVENCNIKEPYDPSQNMQFSNAIGFKGKFYALSLQGSVVVIEDIDSCFRITRIGADRAVPSKLSRQFREYLVELDGEILLVFLMSRKSIDVVEDVEVFRLDIAKLLWVKVESIGDRTLFLEDECCMWVTASKVGCKKNCIYFTHHRVDKWLIFDMESGHISPAFGSNTEIQESIMWGEAMEME
ncbi:hypothetical protein DH2020_045249 [Rehmannia glutinosa]|uniref:KIB1-4 beta-propeller domain-containing protein n=1 Tax=Rehmannia glutinosa TaxID=99300 RepID=A0ABR0UEQ3_REHGL